MIETVEVNLTVNGRNYRRPEFPTDMMLIDFLSEELGLTGTKFCCGIGICRACTVMAKRTQDSAPVPVLACSTPTAQLNGYTITTVEGLAGESLSAIQQAFLDEYAFQCGYCTPGFLMAAHLMIERLRVAPIDAQELDAAIAEYCGDHICRCSGYVRYRQAIRSVVLNTAGLVKSD